jgi:hypothetical protein
MTASPLVCSGTSQPAVTIAVNLTGKESPSSFNKVRQNYWLITLINVGSWREACCRVADSFSSAASPASLCDASVPGGKVCLAA